MGTVSAPTVGRLLAGDRAARGRCWWESVHTTSWPLGREVGGLIETIEKFASSGGMLPEQIWDAPDLDGLVLGGPAGSAMPLVWAHSEYLKLLRSADDGRVFDCIPIVEDRYVRGNHPPSHIEVFKVLAPADTADDGGEIAAHHFGGALPGDLDAGQLANRESGSTARSWATPVPSPICRPRRSKPGRFPLLCSGRTKTGGRAGISKSPSNHLPETARLFASSNQRSENQD